MDINATTITHDLMTTLGGTISRRQLVCAALGGTATAMLSGCGLKTMSDATMDNASADEDGASVEGAVLVVAASSEPYGIILDEFAIPYLAEMGMSLEVRDFDDTTLANDATVSGEVDASYLQNKATLNRYNTEKGASLVAAAPIHYAPFGVYSNRFDTLREIKQGATIALPNDLSGQGHALQVLAQEGVITLKDPIALAARTPDVVENPFAVVFKPMPAADLPRALETADYVVIPPEVALDAGMHPADAVVIEANYNIAAQWYGGSVVTLAANTSEARIRALVQALQSEEFAVFLQKRYDQDLIPIATVTTTKTL